MKQRKEKGERKKGGGRKRRGERRKEERKGKGEGEEEDRPMKRIEAAMAIRKTTDSRLITAVAVLDHVVGGAREVTQADVDAAIELIRKERTRP